MLNRILIRFILVIWMASCSHARIDYNLPKKYPLEVHQLFRDKLSKNRTLKTEGVWSAWSLWTPCSRTCGGGVTMQTRQCISRPADSRLGRGRRRKHLESNDVLNHCVGLYKRYHLCNNQPCPKGHDYRAEQCASFNARPFRGQMYFWEPYLKAGDECALNCRAVGMGFYATLNQTVSDGTPCFHPMTTLLQLAPPGIRGVCVVGLCKSVNSEGVIGAISSPIRAPAPDLCPACVTGCRTISGLFTHPQLPPGYSMVTQVPKGACRLVVAQLKQTRNFIALRNPNGTFILNGDPRTIGQNQEVDSSGTRFTYRRQDSTLPETITAPGPLTQPVDILMVYHQPNPGIKYEYMLPIEQIAPPSIDVRKPSSSHGSRLNADPMVVEQPRQTSVDRQPPLISLSQGDDARPLRRRRRKFAWKINGMTACSKTCAGGIQYPILVCVREHNQAMVLERRCSGLERPRNQTTRCNTQPCPAHWGGQWSACSTTCGPGEQTRILECSQEISSTLTIQVKDGACMEPKPSTTRRCESAPCDSHENELEPKLPTIGQWRTEPWSECSVSCGTGQRTRSVQCNSHCLAVDRPSSVEPCHGPPCPSIHTPAPPTLSSSPSLTSSTSISWWLVTDWTEHCSEGCGTGTQTRWVTCPTGECDVKIKPETTRACSSDKQCGGRWYTGPWGPCSDSCGTQAKQKREVLCVVHVRGQARVVSDMTCSVNEKPIEESACQGSCPAHWFTGEWGLCEGYCPNGIQRREVRCLEYDGRYSTSCAEDMPPVKRNCHCSTGVSTKTDYSSRESSHAQDEPSPDRDCRDQFTNCALVVQARLCQYPYYKQSCCNSCRRSQQDSNSKE